MNRPIFFGGTGKGSTLVSALTPESVKPAPAQRFTCFQACISADWARGLS